MSNRQKFWMVVSSIYGLLFLASWLLWGHLEVFLWTEWDCGLSIMLATILFTVARINIIDPTEKGARFFLGILIDLLERGPVFSPPGCKIEKVSRINIQREIPCNPEHIYRGDGDVPKGKYPPIRITFGPPSEDDDIPEDDPLNARLTAEVVPVVTFRVVDFFKFFTTVGSVEEATQQMEDTSVAMLNEAFAKITPAVAMKNLDTYSESLKQAIDQKVDGWGVEVVEAKVKAINFNHSFNDSIISIPTATANAKAGIILAKGKKKEEELGGEGVGAAEKAVLEGRTAGLKNMAEALNLSGSEVLGAETARGITNNPGQKTIIAGSGGFGDIASAGVVIGEALKSNQQKKEKE